MLKGMRIISFTHWLQGPAASQYLADMGADVIRVEAPGRSFERGLRAAGKDCGGFGTLFLAANRNIRNICIDLKQPEGVDLALKLIATADALIENYRPGVMDRLGLGHDAVRKVNPDIIYASATGYGPDGPLSGRPGQDLLVQARAGLVMQNGKQPTAAGGAVIDQHSATLMALGIVGAYVRKLQGGGGTRVEGSLYNACADLIQEALTHYFSGGHDPSVKPRDERLANWYMEAPYGVYPLKDAAITVSVNSYAKLAEALDSPELRELADADPWTERNRCAQTLAAVLASRTFAEVEAAFEAHGVWYERCLDFEDMRNDPQADYAGIFLRVPIGGVEATLVNHPIRYDGAAPEFRRISLEPGADTREILGEMGLDENETDSLLKRKIVAMGD